MVVSMKIHEKIHSAFFFSLLVLIWTGILAPFVAAALTPTALFFAAISATACFLSFYLTKGRQRIAPVAIITTVILSAIYLNGLANSLFFMAEYLRWLGGSAVEDMSLAFPFFNIFFSGLLLIPLFWLCEKSARLRLALAALLLLYFIISMVNGQEISKLTVCLGFLYFLFVISERMQSAHMRTKTTAFLLPFLLLYLLLLMLFPVRKDPYDWQLARRIYGDIRRAFHSATQRWGSGDEGFGMEVTGFSGGGRLGTGEGSGLFNRSRDVMQVELTSGRRMAVYITGNVFDSFDGREWRRTIDETENEQLTDSLETLYAVLRHDGENVNDYLHYATMRIGYTRLQTAYFFSPLKPRRLQMKSPALSPGRGSPYLWPAGISEWGGMATFDEKQGYGTDYEMDFYQMNMGNAAFGQMIAAQLGYAYTGEADEEIMAAFPDSASTALLAHESLLERGEWIREVYAQPYPLSDDVRAFLQEIVREANSEYEACLLLEKALSGRGDYDYVYTKHPDSLPAGAIFPDFFLLESRAGYCTYYATAFVLLARELGLPVRYVQGYAIQDESLGWGIVTVNDSSAHAWPEVYFQGIGFIPFEPTPGFNSGRYRYWNLRAPSATSAQTGSSAPDERPDGENAPNDTPEWDLASPGMPDYRWLDASLLVILLLMLAALLFVLGDHLLKKRRYLRLSDTERFLSDVRLNLRILALMGYRLMPGETISEFGRRLRTAGLELGFSALLERILYRGEMATAVMLAAVLADRAALYERTKATGRWRYRMLRLRLFIMVGG